MPFKTPPALYQIWRGMRDRCLNPRFRQWADYGGRGITICPEWDSYARFEADMSPRPPGASIDRIDNNGPYSPQNCRWATSKEQQLNRRSAVYVTISGVRYRAVELSEIAGVKTDTIVERAARGHSYEEVVSTEKLVNYRKPVEAIAKRLASQAASTHCKHGHPWSPENTRITPQGHKNCRTCHREKMRLRNAMRA